MGVKLKVGNIINLANSMKKATSGLSSVMQLATGVSISDVVSSLSTTVGKQYYKAAMPKGSSGGGSGSSSGNSGGGSKGSSSSGSSGGQGSLQQDLDTMKQGVSIISDDANTVVDCLTGAKGIMATLFDKYDSAKKILEAVQYDAKIKGDGTEVITADKSATTDTTEKPKRARTLTGDNFDPSKIGHTYTFTDANGNKHTIAISDKYVQACEDYKAENGKLTAKALKNILHIPESWSTADFYAKYELSDAEKGSYNEYKQEQKRLAEEEKKRLEYEESTTVKDVYGQPTEVIYSMDSITGSTKGKGKYSYNGEVFDTIDNQNIKLCHNDGHIDSLGVKSSVGIYQGNSYTVVPDSEYTGKKGTISEGQYKAMLYVIMHEQGSEYATNSAGQKLAVASTLLNRCEDSGIGNGSMNTTLNYGVLACCTDSKGKEVGTRCSWGNYSQIDKDLASLQEKHGFSDANWEEAKQALNTALAGVRNVPSNSVYWNAAGDGKNNYFFAKETI